MSDDSMAPARPAPSLPSTPVATRIVAAVAALSGPIVGLLPGIAAAQAGAFLALVGALVVLAYRRALPPAQRAALLSVALITTLALIPELVPLPPPSDALERASAAAEAQWSGLLDTLDRAVDEPPPAGGDFRWIGPRREALGEDAGVGVLDARTLEAIAWSGWTTPLAPAEASALQERLAQGVATIVLRRGLTLRLLHARRFEASPPLIVTAELALPTEPDAGPVAPPESLGVEARVRWLSLGEGLRADVDIAPAIAEDPTMWSFVPLMSGARAVTARLSLGARPHDDERAAQAARRRALLALLVATAVMIPAFVSARSALWRVPLARALLLVTAPGLARAGAIGADAPWAAWARDMLGAGLASLVDTPASAAITGIALVALAGLLPAPHARTVRGVLLGLALVALAAGAPLAALITRAATLGPLEITTATGDITARLATLLALAAVPWAAGLALIRLARRDTALFAVLAAAIAGALAGAGHGAGVAAGARVLVEREVAPELAERVALWRRALLDAIDLAVPPRGSSRLAPERDAIDLWWKSALGDRGLASGVWRYAPDGALEDAFLSGVPPVDPEPVLASASAGTRRDPETIRLRFVGGEVSLLVAEVARAEGGSWLLGVLDAPDNVPSRAGRDALRGRRTREATARALPPSPGVAPALAWFDAGGRLVGSDLLEAPPAPSSRLEAPRWRTVRLEGRIADALELPDRASGGSVVAVVFRPGALQRAALSFGFAAVLAFAAVFLRAVRVLLGTPREAWRGAARGLRLVANSFRAQLGVALFAAGLLPLLALGVASRAVAQRNADRQLLAAAAAQTNDARRFIEDYLALGVEGEVLDDAVAAWLARTVDADLFAWREGALVATSRPDLVRAGIWPERVWGEIWTEITRGRRALLIEDWPLRPVAHAPVRGAGEEPGVLSVPLSGIGRRIEESLDDVDRALLVSAVLLVALATVIAGPAARRMVRPLEELEVATSRIAGGRFDADVPETGYEETRALARAFREMARSLAAQRRSLEGRRQAMEALIAGMPVAVLATTSEGEVWAANPRASAMLGAHAGSPLPVTDDALVAACRALLAAEGDTTRAIDLPGDTGRTHLRLSAHDLPGMAREGDPSRVLVIEDVSDAVRSERLLAWAGMARRIAHEIKNPLTPISLIVDHVRRMMKDNHPDLPRAQERMLDTIAEQVRVLRETSREFSDYARLLVARPEPIDLRAALETWIEPYRVAPPKSARIDVETAEGLGAVRVDPRLLRRAVVNLVDNALAAIGEGGHVRVSAERDPALASRVIIAVEDDGPGVAAEMVGELFEPDVTTRETGTGLGLPIARQSIETQGGTLELDQAHESGARFVIVLPEPPDAT